MPWVITSLSRDCVDHKGDFRVPEQVEKPTPDEIEENKRQWDYAD